MADDMVYSSSPGDKWHGEKPDTRRELGTKEKAKKKTIKPKDKK